MTNATREWIDDEMLRDVCAALDPEFDSHAVISAVMQQHPQAYTRALYACVESEDPIRTLQDPMARRPAWRDRETEALWQLRI